MGIFYKASDPQKGPDVPKPRGPLNITINEAFTNPKCRCGRCCKEEAIFKQETQECDKFNWHSAIISWCIACFFWGVCFHLWGG